MRFPNAKAYSFTRKMTVAFAKNLLDRVGPFSRDQRSLRAHWELLTKLVVTSAVLVLNAISVFATIVFCNLSLFILMNKCPVGFELDGQ
jgi:hypothetical protein